MAKLQDGTRIYGTLNVNTAIIIAGTLNVAPTLNAAFALANAANQAANAAYNQANTANSFAFLVNSNTVAAFAKANAATLVIRNDTVNATRYVAFINATSGNASTLNISSTSLTFNVGTGTLSATIFNSTSDEKYKKDINTLKYALETTASLRGVSFKWLDNNQPSIGLIAQEVENVIPEIVTTDNNKKTLNYDALIGLLVESIKELKVRIEKLENNG